MWIEEKYVERHDLTENALDSPPLSALLVIKIYGRYVCFGRRLRNKLDFSIIETDNGLFLQKRYILFYYSMLFWHYLLARYLIMNGGDEK